jgi:multidrug efflux pump subunit AcrA (membrane-fusion protein)
MNKKTQIGILILIILAAISYFAFSKISKNKGETKYVLTKAKRETISVSVSGSGNIEAVNEVNILPNVSGKIQNIFVKKGDFVKEGQVLVKLDTSDIENTISGLETQIQTIKMSLETYQKNLEKLENSKIDALNTLDKTYRDTFDFTVSLFDLFSNFFQQVKDWATKSSFGDENEMSDFDYYRHVVNFYSPDKENLVGDEEEKEFQKLKDEYENLKLAYQKLSSFSPKEDLDPFFSELDSFLTRVFEFAKRNKDAIVFFNERIKDSNLISPIPPSITQAQLSTLQTFTQNLSNSKLTLKSSLLKIESTKNSIENLQKDIENQKLSIQSTQLNLEQKEKDLANPKDKLKDYEIRAKISGEITDFSETIKEGDQISPSTLLGKITTKEKIIKISLNEIDAAKVKIDQKAILTFDALPDLTLTGKVIEVDKVGTVSQGVTSYGVKIALDSDDERIKPGMSVNAEIVVDVKPDVLTLPNSAIKSEGNLRYVQLIDAPKEIKDKLKIGTSIVLPKEVKIKNQPVEVGISNDEKTEILSGVSEGDIVISSKVTQQTQTTQTQFRFQIPGMMPQRR